MNNGKARATERRGQERRVRQRDGERACGGDEDNSMTANETARLTPRHLLRQWLPSWLWSGQTTSLFTSVTEKEV